ncbi:MAG TPA: YbaB/EbfC family nucleoid-associated protein [Clostridia bacterium]|nr:YbaB/EbfC family nucleoid-associated protein [Clostridia bacterium]
MKARIPGAPQGGGNMMKQIQDMQENIVRITEEIEASEFSASAGGGAVDVTVNGKHEIISIKMQPEVIDPEDVEMLQDLIIASINEAIRKANEAMEKGMQDAKGGLSIPGLF